MSVPEGDVVAAQQVGKSSVKKHSPYLLSCHCHIDGLLSGWVSAPGAVVVGAEVVEGAALVVVAAVMAAHAQRASYQSNCTALLCSNVQYHCLLNKRIGVWLPAHLLM